MSQFDSKSLLQNLDRIYSITDAAWELSNDPKETEFDDWVYYPVDNVLNHRGESTGLVRIKNRPDFNEKARLIFLAIKVGELPFTDDNGITAASMSEVKFCEPHFSGFALRDWWQRNYPEERPDFLFGSESTSDSLSENDDDASASGGSLDSDLRIIAALYEYIAGEMPGAIDKKHPQFASKTSFIHELSATYAARNRGLAERSLWKKIGDGKGLLQK